MAFIAAPPHPLMRAKHVHLTDLESANLLVRERGSGTRVAIGRLVNEA
ncbi:hypothetical protein [Paraburkholderia sp. BL18I3N2]